MATITCTEINALNAKNDEVVVSPVVDKVGIQDRKKKEQIAHLTSEWPQRYFERFQRWFVRRQEKFSVVKNRTFDSWSCVKFEDCLHHIRNWDSGLKKALLKDKLIDKTRNVVKRIKYHEKRRNQRSAQHGSHPHMDEQIQDKDLGHLSAKMRKIYIDPKTHQLMYLDSYDLEILSKFHKQVEEFIVNHEQMKEQADDGANATGLEETSSVTKSTNLTFVDERPIDTVHLHTKGDVQTKDINNDIAENNWTLNDILTREYPLDQFEWKVGHNSSTRILDKGVPKIITDDVTCMITRQLKFFSFLRAGVHIRVQLNGTKFHCGRLIVYFKPLTWNDDTEENFFSLTCWPHFMLDASVSNSGEIYIPFTHLLSYFSQESGTLYNDSINSLGSIIIRPFNDLRAAEGSSQSLFGQVYLSLTEPYVHLPTYEISAFAYGNGYMQGLESFMKKTAGSLINSGLGLADKYTGGLVTGAGDAICNLLGISDKPLDPTSAAPIINRTVAPLCHGAGLDRSTRLGLSPIAQTNTHPDILGAVDSDFNLLTLCQMPCLLEQPEWSVTSKPGTKIFDMLVTPVYVSPSQITVNNESRYVNYSPTMLAYISRSECLWRGTLMAKIQVIATQFHSGRLALVYDPHGTTKVNLEDFQKNRSHNIIIMDLQEQQELEIALPYFAVKPWLRCDHFRSKTNLSTELENNAYLDCDVTGVFRIFVLNSLVRPDNVPDKIQINVFFYAGNDFELSVPNSLAPLSVRKGPSGVQYANDPKYAWCQRTENTISKYYAQILGHYQVGKKLFDQGFLKQSSVWYKATKIIESTDTINFVQAAKYIDFILESADNQTKKLIESLPNYSRETIQATVKDIDIVTRDSNTKIDKIAKIPESISEVRGQIKEVQSYIENTNRNVNRYGNRMEEKFYELERENKKNFEFTDRIIGDANAKLRSIENKVDIIPKADGKHWEHQAEFNSQGDFYLFKPKGMMSEQGSNAENYTTTRDNEGSTITITSGSASGQAAPNTISENAMQIQTLLRRFYPQYISPVLENSNNFTIITIPVTPSFIPNDEDTNIVSTVNRRYEANVLAWVSRLFTYSRGSIRYKIIVNSDDAEIIVWHNPVDVKDFSVTSGITPDQIVEQTNFATDLAVSRVQQGVEVEVPFYSTFNQIMHSHVTTKKDLRAQVGTLYVAIRSIVKKYTASIFISTGDDFFMNVLRAPPVIHEPFQAAYTNEGASASYPVSKQPEIQRSLQHDSGNVQLPGTFVFNRWKQGTFGECKLPVFAPQDFQDSKLESENQQMVEQMLSIKKVVGDITGMNEAKEIYHEEIKPKINDANDAVQEFRDFLQDFKENVIPAALGHAKVLHGDAQVHLQALSQIAPKIEEALSQFNAFTTSGTEMNISIREFAEKGTEAMGYVAWFGKTVLVSAIWMNIIELYKNFKWTNLINLVLLTCALFQVSPTQVIQWVYANCTKLYEDCRSKATNGMRGEQGFEDFISENAEDASLVLAVIATIVYCGLFGELPTWDYIKKTIKKTVTKKEQGGGLSDFLRSLHFANMGMKAINNAFDFFKEWMTKLVEWYLEKDGKDVLLERQFNERSEEIIKWIDEIAELEDEDFYHKALSDVDTHNRYYKLVDQSRKFKEWLLKEKIPSNVANIIQAADKRLMEMIKRIKEIRPGHGFRYSPFVVMLYGESGCAKSNAMHQFTEMVREELQIPYYHSVCPVPKTKEFFDGYEGQTIVEWDDMLQCPKQDEMVADFINWRSNADCIINKAKVEEKGMHFTSKAIICSTNVDNMNISTIRDMNAFRNRINLRFRCYLAEGITADDMKTMPRDPNFGFMRLDAEITVNEGERYQVIRENLTLQQAIQLAREHFIQWDTKQNELVSEYMQMHGSLRIPKGIVINEFTEAEIDDLVLENQAAMARNDIHVAAEMARFEMMREQGLFYDISRDESIILTEEEQEEAELFEIEFDALPLEEQYKLYNKAKYIGKKVVKHVKRYFEILKNKMSRVKNTIVEHAKDFYKKHPNFVKTMGIITFMGAAAMLVKMIWSNSPNVQEESTYQQDVVKARTRLVKAEGTYQTDVIKAGKKLVKAEGLEQGTDDDQAVEMGRNKIHPLLSIIGWDNTDYQCILQCLAIGGKYILAPHHFFRRAKDGDIFFFMRGQERILVEYASNRMQRIRNKDAVLYYMGSNFDSRKKILNCFVSEKHLSALGRKTSAVLVGTHVDGRLIEKACDVTQGVTEYQGSDEGAPIYKQDGWHYKINTLSGECGSPLILLARQLPPPAKIAGIHTAGFDHQKGGFATLLTREMIEEALEKLIAIHGELITGMSLPPQVLQNEQAFMDKCKVIPEGSFSYYGVMDAKFCPSQPQKTSLRPTPWQHEEERIPKQPAMLKPKDGVSPLCKALKKYGVLTRPFKLRHIQAVKEDMLNELLMLDGDMKPEVTSEKVAILGVAGIKHCGKMDMNTSPGWPYQCLPNYRGQKGKRFLFDEERGVITDELLKQNVTLRESMAMNGERFPSIWRDCMKDELRPAEKVKEGKTRLFTIAPVDFTILVRKYFLAFEQMFYKNHGKFFSAVGINAESYEWTAAFKRLKTYGTKCMAGDFSGYDGTLMADLMAEIGDIIDQWYQQKGEKDPVASMVRKVLFDEMIHTMQLVLNCVYKTHQGNPSGNPLTVIINTMCNAFYIRLAWLEIMEEACPALANMDSFHQYCIEEDYGDDNRIVIREKVLQYFNQVTVAACLARHGIIYTDETKQGELVEYRELETTSFLKRSYRKDPEIGEELMLPIMDKDTILSLSQWYHEADCPEDQVRANMRAALDFAFFHGREFYDAFRHDFAQKMRKHDMKPICITFDEQLNRFLSMCYGDETGSFTEKFIDYEY